MTTITTTAEDWGQLVEAPATRENLRRMQFMLDERFVDNDGDPWDEIHMRGEMLTKLIELLKSRRDDDGRAIDDSRDAVEQSTSRLASQVARLSQREG